VQAARGLRSGGLRAKEQKSHIDSASACVILQAYLEARA
jgi:RNase H-fold protein (predicted Holliday junction resolvase)